MIAGNTSISVNRINKGNVNTKSSTVAFDYVKLFPLTERDCRLQNKYKTPIRNAELVITWCRDNHI